MHLRTLYMGGVLEEKNHNLGETIERHRASTLADPRESCFTSTRVIDGFQRVATRAIALTDKV